jgi:hypothetical protein
VTFRYGVYGLSIEADAPIDGAPSAGVSDPPDLRVLLCSMPPFAASLFDTSPVFDDDNVTIFLDDGAYGFHYADGTRFVVDASASTIWSSAPPSATHADTATYLLGPVLAFVLRRRGTLSLHASAVVIGGKAVAIAAAPGGGKSTTAAAFADRGARVLTDDVHPIVWRDGEPWSIPGYPRLRLWPETVAARYGAEEALPLLSPGWTKRYLDVSALFVRQPMPLRAIVVLRDRIDGPPRIERLGGHEAAMQLVANSSMALYLDAAMRVEELDRVSALVERVPVFAAWPGNDLGRVGELCEAIAEALAQGALSSPR